MQGLLEVPVRVRGSVESERLLVGDDRCGHALARVAIAMEQPHSKLPERTKQRELLRGHLPCSKESHSVLAISSLNGFEATYESIDGRRPIDGHEPAFVVSQERGRPAIG
jgi:hypothetical protein